MPNTFALRFTPFKVSKTELLTSINFEPLAEKCEKFVAAEEGNGNTTQRHFHAHITTLCSEDTIRRLVISSLAIPKMGRGQTNKLYSLKEWDTDISYIVKGGNITTYKGYTEEEIAAAIATGQENYDGKIDEREYHAKKSSHHTSVWEELKAAALNKKMGTYKEFAHFVNYFTLSKGAALQHPANVKRYALSLMILQKAQGDEDTLKALANQVEIESQFS